MTAYERIGAGRVKTADETVESRKRVRGFWFHCEPARGTVVERYLDRRGVPWLAECEAVRFRPECPHPSGVRLPAMVCLVHDGVGDIAALHRVFLTLDGSKALVEPAKASLGSFAGGAIRFHPACPEIVVGEGLETTASAARILGIPGWSAIACGNLATNMRLPDLVRTVTIAADHDWPGRKAAHKAMVRWRKEGRAVRILRPNEAGQDFNDLLLSRGGDAYAG